MLLLNMVKQELGLELERKQELVFRNRLLVLEMLESAG